MSIWQRIKARGRYRVLCDQDEMAHTGAYGYADTRRGAEAIKKQKQRRYRGLTYTVEERGNDGFFRQVKK